MLSHFTRILTVVFSDTFHYVFLFTEIIRWISLFAESSVEIIVYEMTTPEKKIIFILFSTYIG